MSAQTRFAMNLERFQEFLLSKSYANEGPIFCLFSLYRQFRTGPVRRFSARLVKKPDPDVLPMIWRSLPELWEAVW